MVALSQDYGIATGDATLRGLADSLPSANVRNALTLPPDFFVTIKGVPVFAEHTTKVTQGRFAGRELRFGYSELMAVCNRCNERIADTGDYAMLVIGHTPPKELIWSGKAKPPEVIGNAGPFYLGKMTTRDGRGRYCILADFHYYREDFPRIKKFPRRSAELWLEESFGDMFLDPIAHLGAEAPRLDMGLVYARDYHAGRVVEFYRRESPSMGVELYEAAAAAPSATSVFIPSHGDRKQYSGAQQPAGAGPMLDQNDIQQIVQGMMATAEMQFVKSLMAQQGTPGGQGPSGPAPSDQPPQPPQQNAGADAAGGTPPGAQLTAPPPSPATTAPPQQQPQQFAGQDDDEEEIEDASDLEDDDRKDYEGGDVNGVEGKPAAAASVDGSDGAPSAGTAGGKEMYQRLTALMKRVQVLEGERELEKYGRKEAERMAAIQTLVAEGYSVDVSKLKAQCKPNRMSDELFAEKLDDIRENYSRAPDGISLPVFDFAAPANDKQTIGRDGRPEVSHYSKASSDRAFAICCDLKAQGKDANYEAVLEAVHAGKM